MGGDIPAQLGKAENAMSITIHPLIMTLIVGGVAGWLASLLVGGGGGVIRSVIIGVIGAIVGHFVLSALGIRIGGGPWLHALINGVIGGVIVIIAARFLSR